jgi:hypothetical protein
MPGSNCLLCKTLVREVKKIIGKNETKAAIHDALHEACSEIPSPGGESAVDCDNLASMPKVDITLAGKVYTLTPKDYVLEVDQGGAKQCISGFMGLNLPAKMGYAEWRNRAPARAHAHPDTPEWQELRGRRAAGGMLRMLLLTRRVVGVRQQLLDPRRRVHGPLLHRVRSRQEAGGLCQGGRRQQEKARPPQICSDGGSEAGGPGRARPVSRCSQRDERLSSGSLDGEASSAI